MKNNLIHMRWIEDAKEIVLLKKHLNGQGRLLVSGFVFLQDNLDDLCSRKFKRRWK